MKAVIIAPSRYAKVSGSNVRRRRASCESNGTLSSPVCSSPSSVWNSGAHMRSRKSGITLPGSASIASRTSATRSSLRSLE